MSQPHLQGKGNWELFQEIIRAFYFFHEFLYSPFRICPFATFFLFAFFSLCRTPFFRVLMKHKCFLSPFADVFRICMRIGQALAAPCQYSCKSLLQLEGGGEKKKKCATTTVKSGDIVLLLLPLWVPPSSLQALRPFCLLCSLIFSIVCPDQFHEMISLV